MPLAVSLLKWRNDKIKILAEIIMVFNLLRWWHHSFELRETDQRKILLSNQKKGGGGEEKKKKETTLQAPTVFGIFIFHFGITHRFFKAGGFPYAVIVLLCFSGLVLSEKTCNPKSRVRGPDWISDAACWIWEEGGRMWY